MIGREKEQRRLLELADSGEAEFVAVYGRRRVGKTYLVRETFDGDFAFCHSGMARVGTRGGQSPKQVAQGYGHVRAMLRCGRLFAIMSHHEN